uniref:Uncharacterized protein n=1 Tax=Octactis speculum TaxID=3111310 RepID=A0A7S2D704_9STRA|mmetsp:Transcript_44256/g.60461  ORF Transcript_44256/g.60461 Transcript_44256/m.60461 type:complete len:343 (+) Transcript_44256:53-1081(+)
MSRAPTSVNNAVVDAAAGALGGLVSTVMIYPLDVVKTRLQASSSSGNLSQIVEEDETGEDTIFPSFVDTVRDLVRRDGVVGLYAGLAPSAIKSSLTTYVFYFCYSSLRRTFRHIERSSGPSAAVLVNLAHGTIAGAMTQVVVMPLDMIIARLQTSDEESRSFIGAVKGIYREGGLVNFWSSLAPGLLICINPGMTQTIQDRIRGYRGKRRHELTAAESLWMGLVSKAIASVVTYPLSRAKTQMQTLRAPVGKAQSGESGSRESAVQSRGLLSYLAAICRKEGVAGLFRGLWPDLVKKALGEAILTAVRDKVGVLLALVWTSLAIRRQKLRRQRLIRFQEVRS